MKQVTALDIDISGANPILTFTERERYSHNGVMIEPTDAVSKTVTILAPFKLGAGDPATDGTILNQCYYDTDSGKKYLNSAWPNTAVPTWIQI